MRAFLCFSIPEQQSNCILGSTSVVLRTQCFVVLCFLCLVGGTLSYEEICDSPEVGIAFKVGCLRLKAIFRFNVSCLFPFDSKEFQMCWIRIALWMIVVVLLML